jgi:hypothetical protein
VRGSFIRSNAAAPASREALPLTRDLRLSADPDLCPQAGRGDWPDRNSHNYGDCGPISRAASAVITKESPKKIILIPTRRPIAQLAELGQPCQIR